MIGDAGSRRVCGKFLLVFLSLVTVVPWSLAQDAGRETTPEIVATFVRNWPPQYSLDASGDPAGFARDVLDEVAAQAGMSVRFRLVESYADAMRDIQNGRADIIPNLGISAERARLGKFTAPVETFPISVFVRRDSPHLNAHSDLRGRRVGVVQTNVGVKLVSKLDGVIPVLHQDVRSALIDLVAGQLDAVIFPKTVFFSLARQIGLEDTVRTLGAPLLEVKRGILVANHRISIFPMLDDAVRQFTDTRSYERIYAKWYGAPTSFWTASRVFWIVGAVATVGLLASFGWRYHSVARLNFRLREQAAILDTVLDNADQGISQFDADLKSVTFNDRFIELLDLPAQPTRSGIAFESFVRVLAERGEYGSDDVEAQVCERTAYARQFEPRNYIHEASSGKTIDVRGNPIPGGGFVATYTDITDQMRVEDALRVREQQLSEAQRIGRIGHWRYWPGEDRFECSKALRQIYGWDGERPHVSLAEIAAAVHPDDSARVNNIRKDAGERQIAYICEFRIIRPDGAIRHIRGEGRPEFDGDGRLLSFFGVNQDVTDQKQTEDELLRERQRAELANRAKSEFLANMSHEIRTPLNAIIGFADIIDNGIFGPIGNKRYAEYISDIHTSAGHLLDLVNDILDISTIEAGEVALAPESLDISEIFDECQRVVREQARKAKLSLSVELTPAPMTVRADHRAMRQILLNLVSNSIKFTPPGGRISICAEATAERVTIGVSDTGIGIPAELLPTIMEPFETGNTDPHAAVKANPHIRSEGTGLGLAIVSSLAKLHGGDVHIESAAGEGTTVRVWFPQTKRAAA